MTTKDLADLLDVRIYEEFTLYDCGEIYRLTETRLEIKRSDWCASVLSLNTLLMKKIIKLSFEPKFGDVYWSYFHTEFDPIEIRWSNAVSDYLRKANGIVFRTKEEAEKALPIKFKELTGKEWENK